MKKTFILALLIMAAGCDKPLTETQKRVAKQAEIEEAKIHAKEPKEPVQVEQPSKNDDDDSGLGWYTNPANPIGLFSSVMGD